MSSDSLSLDELSSGEICEGPCSDQDTHIGDDALEIPERSEVRFSSQQESGNQTHQVASLQLRSNPLEYITDINSTPGYVDPAYLDLNNEQNYTVHFSEFEFCESHL